jgi:hypothetical protein
VDPLSPPEFAVVVRRLNEAAARAGMRAPSFSSPPRIKSADRTIRWLEDGGVMVSVRRGRRAADAVVQDMIEGVVVANRLSGSEAEDAARKLAACLNR